MKIHNLTVKFTCVQEGPAESCNSSFRVVEYMKGAFDEHPEQESFWVIALNRKNFAKGRQMISLGSATAAIAHPREIFRAAILMSATAIICVHNHPSGDPHPSSADLQLTRQIREAARTVEIELLDHVIIGEIDADPLKKGFYSFRENGLV